VQRDAAFDKQNGLAPSGCVRTPEIFLIKNAYPKPIRTVSLSTVMQEHRFMKKRKTIEQL
jgi:hypothetical protein